MSHRSIANSPRGASTTGSSSSCPRSTRSLTITASPVSVSAVPRRGANSAVPGPSEAIRVIAAETVTRSSYRPGAMLTTAPARARATASPTVR